MSVNQRKVVLLTREEGNNHFWDSSFALRVPFRGNSNGEYKITVTEALFNNTEPLVSKDDWFQFEVIDNAKTTKYTWKVTMKKDWYLYKQGGPEWQAVIKLLVGTLGIDTGQPQYTETPYQKTERWKADWVAATATVPAHWGANINDNWTMSYQLVNEDHSNFTGSNRGVNPIMYYDLYDLKKADTNVINVDSVTMSYSWGFAYILNNTNAHIDMVTDNDQKPRGNGYTPAANDGHYFFEYCNLRLGGPYGYILATPTVKTTVLTQNEANQAYSIVGYVKNTADNHNENVQFISAMEGHVNSLSNFRVQLLKDNFEPVKIRSPLYINLTVSNEEDNGVPM